MRPGGTHGCTRLLSSSNNENLFMYFFLPGGSGRRKLTIIPTDSEGYSTCVLKAASNNGKNTIYVVPIQEHPSTEPLPYDSPEFSKMPLSTCITCGSKMPMQLLPLHVGQSSGTITVRLYCNTSLITQLNMHILCLFENLQIFSFFYGQYTWG